MKNKIVSFSIWGDNPRYYHGAIQNIKLCSVLMPEWTCRIYTDVNKPNDFINEVESYNNAEIVTVRNSTYGMFWRFYPMFESKDNICLSRDTDSRISEREVRCVNEWLHTDKSFSIIRDHVEHYKWPMLGGMWGFKGCLDKELFTEMLTFSKVNKYVPASDQIFLENNIWPIAQHSVLIAGIEEWKWMADTYDPVNFIGQGYCENDQPIY